MRLQHATERGVGPSNSAPPSGRCYHRWVLRAILFDWNGVLVDDEPIHLELLERVLREEGLALPADEDCSAFLGTDDRTCFERALTAVGEDATPDRLSRLIARKSAYYLVRVRLQGFPIFAGAVELVEAAAERGLMLGVVSGALRDEVEGALQQMGVRQHFKCLVTAEDVARGKPDPEGFRRGLELLNSLPPLPARLLHPHEVLAVEDSVPGLEAARKCGLSTLAVAHSHPAETLVELADQVVEGLDAVDLETLSTQFAGAI